MTVPSFLPHALVIAGIAALIAWRIYRRMKMLIGRQRIRAWRLAATTTFFTLALVALTIVDLYEPTLLEALAAGGVAGVALALVGLRLTRFEAGDDQYAYVPNTLLGLAVSLVFVGRIAYRIVVLWSAPGDTGTNALHAFGTSAATVACFALVAAYYATVAAGVLWWYRSARRPSGPLVGDARGT